MRIREGDNLPNDYTMFVLVTLHLFKNAHRYFGLTSPTDMQMNLIEELSTSTFSREEAVAEFKDASLKIRNISTLKNQNRVSEQLDKVKELKKEYGSLRNISDLTGVSLKTVHKWCTAPVTTLKKRVELSKLRRRDNEDFLLQDSISFAHPCKKYNGNRYFRNTIK